VVRRRHKLDELLTARMGGADGYEAMGRACEQLLAQIDAIRPPIKLAPLARLMGAQLDYGDHAGLGREEAAIRLRDGELVLWVSRSRFEDVKTRKRARFSIAHELGHLLMFRMLGPEFLDHSEADASSYALTERLCDFAASQILMPRALLRRAVQERAFTSSGLRSLENLFGVSSQALLKAVADLVPDGAVIELRRFQRRPTEALAWRVWAVTTASTSVDLNSWLPTGCTLKHIRGLTTPESLPEDTAVLLSNLTLVRGRMRNARGAIATRSRREQAPQRDLLSHDRSRLAAGALVQDEQSGQVLLMVGRRGSLETLWPGVESTL
jgi:hypothetical protein